MKVPPHTRADVPFAVTVPASAQPGDHPAALVAAAGGREVGVRLQLRVAGLTLSALTVESVRIDKAHGLIRYALVNRGNTALTPRLALRADGVFGRALDRPARTLPVELLPGQRVELSEPWAHPPALDRVTVRLDVTADGGAAPPPRRAPPSCRGARSRGRAWCCSAARPGPSGSYGGADAAPPGIDELPVAGRELAQTGALQ